MLSITKDWTSTSATIGVKLLWQCKVLAAKRLRATVPNENDLNFKEQILPLVDLITSINDKWTVISIKYSTGWHFMHQIQIFDKLIQSMRNLAYRIDSVRENLTVSIWNENSILDFK